MSRYTQVPNEAHPPPATVWQWAADLDHLADEIAAGRAKAFFNSDGRPVQGAENRALAAGLRINALVGVLSIDGVPAMEEGWALAPHPVRLTVGDVESGDCPGAVAFPLRAGFDDAVAAFYEALDRTVRGCRREGDNSIGSGSWSSKPCLPCTRWADRYISALLPVS